MIYLTEQNSIESIQWFDRSVSKKAVKCGLHGRYKWNNLPEVFNDFNHNSAPGTAGTIKIIDAAELYHRAGNQTKNKYRDVLFININSNIHWQENDPDFVKLRNLQKP